MGHHEEMGQMMVAEGQTTSLQAEYLFPGTTIILPNPTPDSSSNSNDATFSGTSPFYGEDAASNPLQAGLFKGGMATVSADPSIANIWDGGGLVTLDFLADGYGESNSGRMVDNAGGGVGWALFIHNSSVAVAFVINFTTGLKFWRMDNPLSLSTFYSLSIEYNSDDVANVPVIKINKGSPEDITLISDTTGGTGTRADDSAGDYGVGDTRSGGRAWDGRMDNIRLKRII